MHIFTKTIAAIMFTVAVIIVAGCNKSDELNNVSGSFNGHDYVDLGLPSGTLWATCNVGADYWSSTLHNYISERAWSYHFTFENCHLCGTYERTRGQCVRAVLSPK